MMEESSEFFMFGIGDDYGMKTDTKELLENEKEFDGWDSNWYWDNDFDCLSVSDESPGEIISTDISSGCEVTPVVVDIAVVMPEIDSSFPLSTDVVAENRDSLSNEEYLMQFQEKFLRANDLGFTCSISSVSSSLNSTPESSLACELTRTESSACSLLTLERRNDYIPVTPSVMLVPLSLQMQAYCVSQRSGEDSDGVDDTVALMMDESSSPNSIKEMSLLVKENQERKKKLHKKISNTGVSNPKKTDKTHCFHCQDSELLKPSADSATISGYGSHLNGCTVLAISGFSAVVGVFCGVLLGGMLASHQGNLTMRRKLNSDDQGSDCSRHIWEHDKKMLLNSVWAQKYEELVIENADLHIKLQQLDDQMISDIYQAHDMVSGMRREVGQLQADFSQLDKYSLAEKISCPVEEMIPPLVLLNASSPSLCKDIGSEYENHSIRSLVSSTTVECQ